MSRARLVRPWVVALLLAGCAPERFTLADSGADRTIRGAHATREGDIWLVGEAGLVLRYDGEAFVDTSTDADPGPRVPGFWDATDLDGQLYVVGDNGLVLTRAERVYVRDDNRDDARLLTVVRAGPRTLFAGGERGTTRRRDRDEDRWRRGYSGPEDARITGSWAVSEDSVVFSTDRGTVVERVEGDWVEQTVATETSSVPLPLFDVWSATVGADLVAVGLGGAVYRRPAGEDAWRLEDTGTEQDLYAVFGTRPDDVFAVGARGTVLHYDGVGWTSVPSSTPRDLFGVTGTIDGSLVVAGGDDGAVIVLRR